MDLFDAALMLRCDIQCHAGCACEEEDYCAADLWDRALLHHDCERRGRDSDPGTQLCRLPPNHSATAPESRG